MTATKNKSPTDRETIKQLQRWLAIPGNTKALIAATFGYANSTTVDHWIMRGRLPGPRRADILKFIGGKECSK